MAVYVQNADMKIAIHPDGAQIFAPESLVREFPALTPHVFVLSDKEYFGPFCQDIIEVRLNNFYSKKEEVSHG